MIRMLLFLLAPSAIIAADLTGIWVGQIPGRNNVMLDIAFKLTQRGEALEGKQYGDYRSSPIVEGSVSGEEIMFVILSQEQAGNQINQTRFRFTGRMVDGELELTREREGATNAGNAGGVQFRGAVKQTFRVKRLI